MINTHGDLLENIPYSKHKKQQRDLLWCREPNKATTVLWGGGGALVRGVSPPPGLHTWRKKGRLILISLSSNASMQVPLLDRIPPPFQGTYLKKEYD